MHVATPKSQEMRVRAVAGIQTHDLLPRVCLLYHLTYTAIVIGREMLSF
jgi:hypothetical protein